MAGHPTTGVPSTYEDGDEHNYSQQAVKNEQLDHLINAKGYMPKGQNKAMDQMLEEDIQGKIADRHKTDPTYTATIHGNEPSRGAQVDAEIQAEEAEMLKKKQAQTDSLPGKK